MIKPNAIVSTRRVLPGDEIVKRVYGGFKREKTTQAGLLVETEEECIFVPDLYLKLAGYQWKRGKSK